MTNVLRMLLLCIFPIMRVECRPCTAPMVIYFPRYYTECSNENWTLGGIFRVVSRFPLHFVLYRGNLDYLWDSVAAVGPMAWWWLYCVDRILGAMGTASWIMANSLIVFFFFREREGGRQAGRKWNSRIRDSQKLGNEKMHEKLYSVQGTRILMVHRVPDDWRNRIKGVHKVGLAGGESRKKNHSINNFHKVEFTKFKFRNIL